MSTQTLSPCQLKIAYEIAKGLQDKEIADRLSLSIETVKTQKKKIREKLKLSNNTEICLFLICDSLKKNFDIKEIRKHGIEIIFCLLFIIIQISYSSKMDIVRSRTRNRIATRHLNSGKRFNELDLKDYI